MNRSRIGIVAASSVFLVLALPPRGAASGQNAGEAKSADGLTSKPKTVLSARRMEPPLRSGNRRVVYSPDGRYLLTQDDGGISLFTRKPLAQKFLISSQDVLPAVFTADSQKIVIASESLQYEVVSVDGYGQAQPKEFGPDTKACLAAKLSPAGNALVCLDEAGKLHSFDVASGKEAAEFEAFPTPLRSLTIENLSQESAFSEPFGDIIDTTPSNRVVRSYMEKTIRISPDGRYLLWETPTNETEGFDLERNEKVSLPGSLKHRALSKVEFVSTQELAAMDAEKPGESALIGFPGGETFRKLNLAGIVTRTSSPQYVLYSGKTHSDGGVVDLKTMQIVSKLEDPASDVWSQELATYTAGGNLEISNFEGTKMEAVPVAAGWLPRLTAASATPDLGGFVTGTGEAAAFNTTSGKRIAQFDNARGAWCPSSTECYVEVKPGEQGAFDVKRINLATGMIETAWTHPAPNPKDRSMEAMLARGFYEPSGSVILRQSANSDNSGGSAYVLGSRGSGLRPLVLAPPDSMEPYNLQSLDMRTGKEMWKRKFGTSAPVPFSDPQGDRLVLGWSATSEGGRKAAKGNAIAEKALRADKKSEHDIYFEILDAQTGRTLAGVLVESNVSADNYDEAFSEGDWLVLAKDGQRVMVEAISTGQEILKLRGWLPAIHAVSARLCLATEENRLEMYDLRSGRKLKDYHFSSPVAYAQFSADGKKLLVVTKDQGAFVLDVSNLRSDTGS